MSSQAALLEAYPVAMTRARAWAGNRQDAEDAVHDAMLRLLGREGVGSNPGGLLWVTTRNILIDMSRARAYRRYRPIPDWWRGCQSPEDDVRAVPAAIVETATPEDTVIRQELRAAVRRTLSQLPAIYRDALMDAYIYERPMRSSDPTFRSRVRRGREQFRALWMEVSRC